MHITNGFELPVPTRSGFAKSRCFVLLLPPRLFGAGASGAQDEPTVPRWPVKVSHGHWGYEGTWVVAGGEMSCGFWGQILQHSDGMELPEALYNLPRQLSPFPKAYPGKQGQLPAAHPLLQISPKSASGRS